ncbi:hypothetical protein KKF70_05090 [bacterium]|nr:hypothetical protein [bacterium]MBU3929365.1 hypothetical protein [bacterium]
MKKILLITIGLFLSSNMLAKENMILLTIGEYKITLENKIVLNFTDKVFQAEDHSGKKINKYIPQKYSPGLWSKDDKYLIITGYHKNPSTSTFIYMWEETKGIKKIYLPRNTGIHDFSPDNKYLICVLGKSIWKNSKLSHTSELFIYDLQSGKIKNKKSIIKGSIYKSSWKNNNEIEFIVIEDKIINGINQQSHISFNTANHTLKDYGEINQTDRLNPLKITSLDKKYVAENIKNAVIKVIKNNTNAIVTEFNIPQIINEHYGRKYDYPIGGLMWLPDSKKIQIGISDGSDSFIIDVETQKSFFVLDNYSEYYNFRWSNTGKYLACTNGEGVFIFKNNKYIQE